MTLDGSEVHTRFQHLLVQLQIEAGVLDRIVYRNKNQHRHGSYFQYLLKVRRDLKLLQSTELGLILKMLFPIIDGKKSVRTTLVRTRLKSKSIGLNHNLKNRLLGCARLLSQMTEPILKAAIQISLLLAKSFFSGFCITVMALLARLRVLVQQMLQDVVIVFNNVSFLTTEKQSIKLSQDGIEVYREFHRHEHKRLVLECVWKGDKYLLLERTESTEDEIRCDIQATPSSTTTIQYKTLELFDEDQTSYGNLPQGSLVVEDFVLQVPFASIDEIADDSPAAEDGLQLGDEIVKFGNVQMGDELQSRLVAEAQSNHGNPIHMEIVRQGVMMHATVTPRTWRGRGLLGCHFRLL